ncbi:MAG: exonuclease domain-containing protein [Hyphomicrobiales bacterium]|nr:exonuclease domain-containing protein [Hyphomicrobiales bacterium]
MRPGLLLTLIFVALAVIAIVLAAAAGWAVVSSGAFAEPQPVLLVGSVALLAFLLALIIAWVVMQLRLIRPLETITREVETLAHAKKLRPMDIPDGHTTGGLVDALHGLIAKFIAARQETGKAVEEATQRGDRYKKRLEAILLDMSEGVIVCNLDNRILLYNKAAIRILKKAGALGLGRRLFGLFEREPILAALDDLIAKQRADTTQKLSIRRQVTCTRLDKSAALKARLALICTDEVETEGYVLTFIEADAGADEEDVLPPRPEFYNFDLFKRQPEREVTEIPLKELRCVVFDTETTGLQPSKGDELVSIGAVRVVNGRIVSGETFEQLINPGKKIPKTSIKFHGITDADIKDEPSANEVLPRFHTFVGRAVLVAHNAAFDMKFLEMKERQSGVSFTSPVLDILLLSAFLHDHASDQSLAATAERLGVDISARHTALGDAMTTARIFLALLDPLHARGVITLGDAFDVSEKMVKIRKQQANF